MNQSIPVDESVQICSYITYVFRFCVELVPAVSDDSHFLFLLSDLSTQTE